MGAADLFDWLHSKMPKSPAATPSPGALGQPDALLADLRQRIPRYLADVDQNRLISPACQRTPSDADSDVSAVWDHTRLEAMQYVIAVPGNDFGLLIAASRQAEMIDGYLLQRPHENTVIDFTGTATADFAIAIVAGLNRLTHCAELAGVPPAQQTGTLRHFRQLVTLAQKWWQTEGAIERCGQMLESGEQPPLMLTLIWTEYTRLAKQIAAAAVLGASVNRPSKGLAAPADLILRFEAAREPEDLAGNPNR